MLDLQANRLGMIVICDNAKNTVEDLPVYLVFSLSLHGDRPGTQVVDESREESSINRAVSYDVEQSIPIIALYCRRLIMVRIVDLDLLGFYHVNRIINLTRLALACHFCSERMMERVPFLSSFFLPATHHQTISGGMNTLPTILRTPGPKKSVRSPNQQQSTTTIQSRARTCS